ncbi:MAG: hypothetical protein KJ622_06045 [Alphaproteobacteria bacterium]|nr:hypothetical protein [Alphaproteobacteria bacterium]
MGFAKGAGILFCMAASFATGLLNSAIPAHSLSIDELYESIDEAQPTYEGFDFPAPEQLLNTYQLEAYNEKLDRRECRSAFLELAGGVHFNRPDMPSPAGDGMLAWEYIVGPRYYPAPLYCRILNDLNSKLQNALSSGLTLMPLPQSKTDAIEFRNPDDPIWGVALEVQALLVVALADHAPALVKIAQLSNEGAVIRLTPAFNYFAIARARKLGARDRQLEQLIAEARSRLTEAEIARLQPRIADGRWPRAERIVLD